MTGILKAGAELAGDRDHRNDEAEAEKDDRWRAEFDADLGGPEDRGHHCDKRHCEAGDDPAALNPRRRVRMSHETSRYRLPEDDQREEDHADRQERQADRGVPLETDEERETGRHEGHEGQHPRPPFEERAGPPELAVGSVVRGDDDARPAPGLNREEQEPDREGDGQAAQSIFANAAHEIASLGHEEQDRRDADGERRDDRDAGRAIVDVDKIAPSRGEAAEGVGRPRRDAARRRGERHRAAIVGITLRTIVGEDDKLAGPREGLGASGADRECRGIRARPRICT